MAHKPLLGHGSEPLTGSAGPPSKDYPMNGEPCIFPAGSCTSEHTTRPRSINIPLDKGDLMHAFCNNLNIVAFDVFKTAWALILRCYTGNESVSFGCKRNDDGYSIEDAEKSLVFCSSIHFQENASVLNIMENMRMHGDRHTFHHGHSMTGSTQLFNTTVSLQRQPKFRKPPQGHTQDGINASSGEDAVDIEVGY